MSFKAIARGVADYTGFADASVYTVVKFKGGYICGGGFWRATNKPGTDDLTVDNCAYFKGGKWQAGFPNIYEFPLSGTVFRDRAYLGCSLALMRLKEDMSAWEYVDDTGIGACNACKVFNDKLYVGGELQHDFGGGGDNYNIITWNESEYGDESIDDIVRVHALCVGDLDGTGDRLYAACGAATDEQAGVYSKAADGDWEPVGALGELYGSVTGIGIVYFAVPNVTRLIAVGNPLLISGGGQIGLAMWDGETWTPYVDYPNIDGQIYCGFGHDKRAGEFLFGGTFTELNGPEARRMARLWYDPDLGDFTIDRLTRGYGGANSVIRYIGDGGQ